MENVHTGVPCVLLMLQSTEYNTLEYTLTTSSWVQVLSWSCSNGQACGFCSQPESDGTWHPYPAKQKWQL